MTCITLLTDFGTRDEYAGVIKGVILGIDPTADVIDLTHGISAGNVLEAAWTLKTSYDYFPVGSIHLAVVDPGVGTDRDIIAVSLDGHLFMAPNNGLLWPILGESVPQTIYRVTNESLYRQPVSRTFHGRDIFAPVGAYLSKGGDLPSVGTKLPWDRVAMLDNSIPRIADSMEIQGVVVSVDRFGNIVTNIRRAELECLGPDRLTIQMGGHRIQHWVENYASGHHGEPVAILGSRNCLEIAVNGASAADTLSIGHGAQVRVSAWTLAGAQEV